MDGIEVSIYIYHDIARHLIYLSFNFSRIFQKRKTYLSCSRLSTYDRVLRYDARVRYLRTEIPIVYVVYAINVCVVKGVIRNLCFDFRRQMVGVLLRSAVPDERIIL